MRSNKNCTRKAHPTTPQPGNTSLGHRVEEVKSDWMASIVMTHLRIKEEFSNLRWFAGVVAVLFFNPLAVLAQTRRWGNLGRFWNACRT